MEFTFFPRQKTFWVYHCSVLFVIFILTMAITILYRGHVFFNLIGNLFWPVMMTMTVLYFRKLYKTTRVGGYGTGKFILFVFVYGVTSALAMSILLALGSLLFFSAELNAIVKETGNTTLAGEIVKLILGNTLQTQLFVCLWIFIYTNITNYRRSREMEVVNLRLQNSLKEAQLHSLANQLNPHFLFNALNNIRFMMHESVAHADSMVLFLSDILRYSLETSRQEKIALVKELEIIQRYIALVKIQFEDRLDFRLSVREGLDDCLIPPMTLQLLVENAVKHGVDKIRGGGVLSLTVDATPDRLKLCVMNDFSERRSTFPSSTGIGLQNIGKRMHLLYGDAATLSNDVVDNRFVVCIELPLERTL